MTTRLWARPCGGLTHAEDRLVLDTIQPPDRKAGAADPSHHGYVAVSEEAMHGEIDWKGVQMNGERKKESTKKQWRKERNSDVQSILRGGVWSLQGLFCV